MARAGITYVDVVKAAETIQASGQEPTVDRVREQLKTGSKSTIAPFLKRWRSEEGVIQSDHGLPSDLLEVVKSLYERTQQMAEVRIEDAKQEFQAAKGLLLKDQAEANITISQLTVQQDDLAQQNKHLAEENLHLRKSLEEARLILAKTESQRDTALARVADLTSLVGDLKQENRDIRSHFEHYQERTAENLQQEREQFRASQRQLQDRIDIQLDQMAQIEAKSFALQNENTDLKLDLHKVQHEEKLHRLALVEKASEVVRLNQELTDSLSKIHLLSHQLEQLREKHNEQRLQSAADSKALEILTESLRKMEGILADRNEKIESAEEENRTLIQEKEVIQEQLKRLQNSLPRNS